MKHMGDRAAIFLEKLKVSGDTMVDRDQESDPNQQGAFYLHDLMSWFAESEDSWISVEDELPGNQLVLVWVCRKDVEEVRIGYLDIFNHHPRSFVDKNGVARVWVLDQHPNTYIPEKRHVSHWRPLPTRPQPRTK